MEACETHVHYYIVQKNAHYYSHDASYTKEEEEAYAFSSFEEAKKIATTEHATVEEKFVSYIELEQLDSELFLLHF